MNSLSERKRERRSKAKSNQTNFQLVCLMEWLPQEKNSWRNEEWKQSTNILFNECGLLICFHFSSFPAALPSANQKSFVCGGGAKAGEAKPKQFNKSTKEMSWLIWLSCLWRLTAQAVGLLGSSLIDSITLPRQLHKRNEFLLLCCLLSFHFINSLSLFGGQSACLFFAEHWRC